MSVGYFLRVGDSTNCGGKILTGDPTFQWYGVSTAREGDMVTCGKHPGTYKILGGAADTFDDGRFLAGSLDSFSS
ncbi:PAAR domain-containing protein [Atlantibacter hermannii]|nr:PAAR domain-containing protein [Atlantibacter hermannii]